MNNEQNAEIEIIAKAMCSSYGPYCGSGCLIERCPIESFAKNLVQKKYQFEQEVARKVLQELYDKCWIPNEEENTSYSPCYIDYRDIEEMAEEYGVEVSS